MRCQTPQAMSIKLYDLSCDISQELLTFRVQNETLISDLISKIKKIKNKQQVQLFLKPKKPFESDPSKLLLPILKNNNIYTIYFKTYELLDESENRQCLKIENNLQISFMKRDVQQEIKDNNIEPEYQKLSCLHECTNQALQIVMKKAIERQEKAKCEICATTIKLSVFRNRELGNEGVKYLNYICRKDLKQIVEIYSSYIIFCSGKCGFFVLITEPINNERFFCPMCLCFQQTINLNFKPDLICQQIQCNEMKLTVQELKAFLQKEKENVSQLKGELNKIKSLLDQSQKQNKELQKQIKQQQFFIQENKQSMDLYSQNQQLIYKNQFINQQNQIQENQINQLIMENSKLKKDLKEIEQRVSQQQIKEEENINQETELEEIKRKYEQLQLAQIKQSEYSNNIIVSLKLENKAIFEKEKKLQNQVMKLNNQLKSSLEENQILKLKLDGHFTEVEKYIKIDKQGCYYCEKSQNLFNIISNSIQKQKLAQCKFCLKQIKLPICKLFGSFGEAYIEFKCKFDLKQIQKKHSTWLLQCKNEKCSFFCFEKVKIPGQWLCPYCPDNSNIQEQEFIYQMEQFEDY